MPKQIKKPKPETNSLIAATSVSNRIPAFTAEGISAQITAHSGPLPDPLVLKTYEQVLPGLAERIVKMAEGEVDHRHQIEHEEQMHRHKVDDEVLSLNRDAINIDAKERKRGQTYGLIIAMAGLIASVISVSLNAQATASIIGGTTVVGLVTVFVTGKLKEPKQAPQEKTNMPDQTP